MVPYLVQVGPFLLICLICVIGGALAYPFFCRVEDAVLRAWRKRNPMLRDPKYRSLAEEIADARRRHKPVKHLLKRQGQMIHDAITAASKR